MTFEISKSNEVPSRVGVRSAIEQNPNFAELLTQVEGLSRDAYVALDLEINKGEVTYNDFALYVEDKKDLEIISGLLNDLEVAADENEKRKVAGLIAEALL